MAGREWVDVIPGLWSLGVQYHGVDSVSVEDSDPELTILKTLKHYWGADDVFFLMLALLKYRIRELIHVDRLCNLAQSGLLSEDEKVLLISVASKMIDDGDTRFKIIRKKLYKKGMTFSKLPELLGMPEVVKAHGAEESLLEFGVRVRKFELYEENPALVEKKLASIGRILSRNDWLKMRALMGANTRADVIYLISSGQAKTAYEAGKIAGCTMTSAYRCLKYAKEFKDLKRILDVS